MDVRDPGGTAASWWDLDKAHSLSCVRGLSTIPMLLLAVRLRDPSPPQRAVAAALWQAATAAGRQARGLDGEGHAVSYGRPVSGGWCCMPGQCVRRRPGTGRVHEGLCQRHVTRLSVCARHSITGFPPIGESWACRSGGRPFRSQDRWGEVTPGPPVRPRPPRSAGSTDPADLSGAPAEAGTLRAPTPSGPRRSRSSNTTAAQRGRSALRRAAPGSPTRSLACPRTCDSSLRTSSADEALQERA
jgi:hypothetical protein